MLRVFTKTLHVADQQKNKESCSVKDERKGGVGIMTDSSGLL